MYRVLLAISVILGGVQSGFAATLPCASGSLSNYLALGPQGCAVGDLDFSGFSSLANPPGSSAISPGSVAVSPLSGGFMFTFNLTANTGQLFETVLGFDVASLTGQVINGESLGLGGSSASVDGATAGVETSCIAALDAMGGCPGGPAGRNLAVFALDPSLGASQTSDQIGFPGVSLLGATLDLSADGGTAGSAVLGSASKQFTEAAAPEPGTMWIAAGALSVLALLRRRIGFAVLFSKEK